VLKFQTELHPKPDNMLCIYRNKQALLQCAKSLNVQLNTLWIKSISNLTIHTVYLDNSDLMARFSTNHGSLLSLPFTLISYILST